MILDRLKLFFASYSRARLFIKRAQLGASRLPAEDAERESLKSPLRDVHRHKSYAKFADLSTGGRFSKEYRRVAGMRPQVCLL